MSRQTDRDRRMHRRWMGICMFVFAAAVVVRGWILCQPIAALDGAGMVLQDDGYISLEIAKNIGQGHGPLFEGRPTNGFQPLWVFLTAIPFSFYGAEQLLQIETLDQMVRVALVLLNVFDLASLVLFAAILHRRFDWGPEVAAGMTLWALHSNVLWRAFNGLETSMALFALLGLWWVWERWPFAEASWRRTGLFGLLWGVAATVRIDFLLLGPFIAFEVLRDAVNRGGIDRNWWSRVGALGAGGIVAYAPWLVYSYHHTGRLFPSSGTSVRLSSLQHFGDSSVVEIWATLVPLGLQKVFANMPVVVLLAVLSVVAFRSFGSAEAEGGEGDENGASGGVEVAWARLRWVRLPLWFGVSIFLAYTLYIHGEWFFGRYFAPLAVPAFALVAAGVGDLADRVSDTGKWRFGAGAAAVAALAVVCVAHPAFRHLVDHKKPADSGYRAVGLWVHRNVPADATVASLQTGGIGYYTPDRDAVNFDGVVNAEVLEVRRNGDWLDWLCYLPEKDVDYVVDWERDIAYFLARSRKAGVEILEPVRPVEEIRNHGRTWTQYRVVAGAEEACR